MAMIAVIAVGPVIIVGLRVVLAIDICIGTKALEGLGAEQPGNECSQQWQEDNGLIYHCPSALHHIDIFNRDGAAVAEIGHQNGEANGGFTRRNCQHQECKDLADQIAKRG